MGVHCKGQREAIVFEGDEAGSDSTLSYRPTVTQAELIPDSVINVFLRQK